MHAQIAKLLFQTTGVTLLNNAQAGKRVNVTGFSHLAGVSPVFENSERIKKSMQLTQKVVQLQQSGKVLNCQTIFEILHHMNAYWKTVYENARGIRYAIAWLL